MAGFSWRKISRIGALVDLVMTCMGFLGFTLSTLMATYDKISILGTGEDACGTGFGTKASEASESLCFKWITVAIGAGVGTAYVSAAVMVLISTKKGANNQDVIKISRIWRNVSLIFLISSISLLIALDNIGLAICGLIVRVVILCFAFMFTRELVNASSDSTNDVPEVTINNSN